MTFTRNSEQTVVRSSPSVHLMMTSIVDDVKMIIVLFTLIEFTFNWILFIL